MDLSGYEWSYDVSTNAIVTMTTTVVHTYFHLGHMHEITEPNVPLAPANTPEALPAPPLALWDLPLSQLTNFKMKPMSLALPSVEILPQLAIPVIELSSTATLMMVAAFPPYLEYHPGVTPTHVEDSSQELSTATSHTLHMVEFSRCTPRVEVLSRPLASSVHLSLLEGEELGDAVAPDHDAHRGICGC